MRKMLLCMGVALATTISIGHAQTLQSLKDSCYHYLAIQDIASFNATYIQLPDALEKEMNPEVYSLVKELKQMRNEDQGIRLLLIDASKRYGDRDKRTVEIRQMMKRIDSKNALRVQQIIDLYGWLGSDELGEEANETLFLCIQHADDLIIQTKYLPILKKAMEEGNADGCIIRKSKFPQNPKRSVRFSGKRTKRSVQKRKARNTQKAETKVL